MWEDGWLSIQLGIHMWNRKQEIFIWTNIQETIIITINIISPET